MDVFLDESIPSVHSNHIRGGKLAARPFIDGNAHCVLQIRGDSDIKSPAWMRHSVFADELLDHNILSLIHIFISVAASIFSEVSPGLQPLDIRCV